MFCRGGRANQTIYGIAGETTFLVDCGPTVLLQAQRLGMDLDTVDAVFLTHTHGDHALGLPFLLLNLQYMAGRSRPLSIVGPPGFEDYPDQALRIAFPDVHKKGIRFPIEVRTLSPEDGPVEIAGMTVQAFAMVHSVVVNGYRFERDGARLAVSGDTALCESLVDLAREADLLIVEYSSLQELPGGLHITLEELQAIKPRLTAKRIALIHTDTPTDPLPFEMPADGDTLEID